MSGRMIKLTAAGGSTPAYLCPPTSGRGPGIIVIQEWWGLVDHIKEVCDRFAAEGFVALAPDLYHGESTTNPDEAGRKMMALDIETAGHEFRGAADYLLGLDEVTSKHVGVVGFCMGGQLALLAATRHPQIAACVDFYGIHPDVEPDFSQLQGPVLGHFATNDEFVSTAAAHGLAERIRGAGKTIDLHMYEAKHAFFNNSRPEVYSKDCAALAWDRTLKFLRANVG